MIHIVTDSSSLYPSQLAKEAGFHVVPLEVIVDQVSYDDFDEISPKQMSDACRAKKEVSTSQPSIGRKIELYNELLENLEDQIIDITICDGLSGTYQSAVLARTSCDDPERVFVTDSKTLCGPQKAIVEKAVEMRNAGNTVYEILAMIEQSGKNDLSCVIVSEIGFILRGGRLPAAAIKATEMLKLMPIAFKEPEAKKLSVLGCTRTMKKAFDTVLKGFIKRGFNEEYKLYICHADNEADALKARNFFLKTWPNMQIEIHELCPLFICHGGPGCVALQAIKIEQPALSAYAGIAGSRPGLAA